jgi:predicted O-methyltransferase YrrM
MLHSIPQAVAERMRFLEEIDARDREDGTSQDVRLRQVPPETGRFLALLAVSAPPGEWLEIGTSAGYSALWISLACREAGRRLVTFESLEEKIALARETIRAAGLGGIVDLVEGDARDNLAGRRGVSFCFLDADKEVYLDCYEAVVPNLVPGGLLAADNAISHQEVLADFLDRCEGDVRVDSLVVPIGRGVLLCRKV